MIPYSLDLHKYYDITKIAAHQHYCGKLKKIQYEQLNAE